MFELPPLKKKKGKEVNMKLPDVEVLDENHEKKKFKKHFDEFEANEELASNESTESSYRSLFEIFKEKDNSNLVFIYEEELKEKGLYNLEKLEKAVESEELDLNEFNVFALSKVIQKLEKISAPKDLLQLGIKTMDDFYDSVANGEIELSKYTQEEIDNFIKNLTL